MTDLWIGDTDWTQVFKVSTDDPTTVLDTITPAGWDDVAGVAMTSGTDMWIAEQLGGHANTIVHMLTDGTTVEYIPNWDPGGFFYDMGYDGTHLLVANNDKSRIDYVNPSTLSLDSTLDISSVVASPTGVSHHNGSLWVVNAYSDNKIYQLTTAGALVTSYSGGWSEPLGVHHDGEFLWVTDAWLRTLTKMDPSTGSVLETHDLSSWSFQPTGVTSAQDPSLPQPLRVHQRQLGPHLDAGILRLRQRNLPPHY